MNEIRQGFSEPILTPETAQILLVETGRAELTADGGLNVDVKKLDSIGLAALQIHRAGEPAPLSEAMEHTTGRAPVLSARQLGELVAASVYNFEAGSTETTA